MRLLQLSDPHLLADPRALCRGRPPLESLRHGIRSALQALAAAGMAPDRLLLSGDLCHDESWGGYLRLRELLAVELPSSLLRPLLLPGNHDHPALLRACLGRHAAVAPGLWPLGNHGPGDAGPAWSLLALDSHCCGRDGGRLGAAQWAWLEALLAPDLAAAAAGPLLVALHHPPLPIGDPAFDRIGLEDGERLLALLARCGRVRGVVFGHVHQYWLGHLPARPEVPLLGCPSSLCPFGPVQPCPQGRSEDPGGLLLELTAQGDIRHRLLRWQALQRP
jgi:Icc protein